MIAGKKRLVSHIKGDEGVRILKKHLPKEWVAREYVPDYGIDLSVELFEAVEGGYITKGEHLLFQVKATDKPDRAHIVIPARDNVEKVYRIMDGESVETDVIKFVLDTDLLATVEAMGSAVPVILVVVDINTEDAYFLCLNDYIEKVLVPEDADYTDKGSKTLYVPVSNKLNNENGIRVLGWYAKRAKLYALFNKLHYQAHELEYCGQHEIEARLRHFLKIIMRSDAWSACEYFGIMELSKKELDSFMQRGITKDAERVISKMAESGVDVDDEVWETGHFAKPMSFRKAQRISSMMMLWSRLANLGNVYEDYSKEFYLPTYIGVSREKMLSRMSDG